MDSPTNVYPCHINPEISPEQFIPDHIFIHMIAGTMTVYDRNNAYHLNPGDYCLAKRNHLARYIKRPPENGKFESTALFFDQNFLRSFSKEYNWSADTTPNKNAIIKLDPNPWLESYIQSLTPYRKLKTKAYDDILSLKNKEIVLILLKTNPDLKNILFDFSDPGKLDLELFMNQNYRFNVSLERFAYLSGRSITTFKRDFEKVFNTSPGRWLLEKRLQEAYFLIDKKGQRPSDVYLQVGFEDLSHFSFAFKKLHGVAPSSLVKV
ncbi:MAG TPA: AraC family transcriptional regulator [Chryseolinea sp.]